MGIDTHGKNGIMRRDTHGKNGIMDKGNRVHIAKRNIDNEDWEETKDNANNEVRISNV